MSVLKYFSTVFTLCHPILLLTSSGLLFPAMSLAAEWSGFIGIEGRYFTQAPQDPRQFEYENFSLVVEPEFSQTWDDGRQIFAFVPFVRLDQHDDKRTHFDVRELTWEMAAERWELRLGVRKVFWGVAEFQHLIDIINQTDLVENIDTEDKLGQPMVNVAWINEWGTLDFFVLPYFRERTFPGKEGRLRTLPQVDVEHAQFESDAEALHPDLAVRYSHFIGDWDIGLAHFYGTSREPRLFPATDSSGRLVLVPFYDLIHQTSLDVQVTTGNLLWKFEGYHRRGQGKAFSALVGGFEYSFVGIFHSVMDLGLLGEYHYNDLGRAALTIFEDDIAVGTRLALNDAQSTEALLGLIFDRTTSGKFFNLEASRRIGDNLVAEFQARLFFGQSAQSLAFALTRDDYVELNVSYHF